MTDVSVEVIISVFDDHDKKVTRYALFDHKHLDFALSINDKDNLVRFLEIFGSETTDSPIYL